VKVKFVLQDIKEARIIRGLFEDNNIETRIYSDMESIDDNECDIIFIDSRAIEGVSWNLKIKGDPQLVIIVPSWFKDVEAKKMGEKLGFKDINYIKRPLTSQELLEYCLKLKKE